MTLKYFLDRLNFTSDCIVEICDVDLSLDNRTRLCWNDMHKGDYRGFKQRKVSSFTVANGRLTIYVN